MISSYLSDQDNGLTLVTPGRVTLGGLKGSVPVSISNRLRYPVLLRVQVTVPRDGRLSVREAAGVVRVAAGTVVTIKLAVSSAATGSTTLHLSLLTPGGVPLPGQPVTMTVQATHYGTLALVIIAAALGVFMLTSATRAIRRGRTAADARGAAPRRGASPREQAAAPRQPAASPDQAAQPRKADNVESGHAETHDAADADAPEDADEYARTPGRADRD